MSVFNASDLSKIAESSAKCNCDAKVAIDHLEFAIAKDKLEKSFSLITYLLNVIDAGDLPTKPSTEDIKP